MSIPHVQRLDRVQHPPHAHILPDLSYIYSLDPILDYALPIALKTFISNQKKNTLSFENNINYVLLTVCDYEDNALPLVQSLNL